MAVSKSLLASVLPPPLDLRCLLIINIGPAPVLLFLAREREHCSSVTELVDEVIVVRDKGFIGRSPPLPVNATHRL